MKSHGFALAALTAIFLAGCSSQEAATTTPVEQVRPVLTVTAEPNLRGQTVTYTGEVVPHTETPIAFKSNGRISERLVVVGDQVKKGQTLVVLETSEFQDQVLVAEAEEQVAQAAVSASQQALDRQTALMDKGLSSRATFDAAVLEANSARSRLETAQANLSLARKALEQTVLEAPMDGVVTAISGNVSQVIAAGQEVMRIASLDRPDAVFDVPEQIITAGGSQDQIVSLALLSNGGIVANGRITEVSPMADPSTRTYRVRVAVEDAPPGMIYGASVVGTLIVDDRQTFEIPVSSLTSMAGNPAVYVVESATHTLVRKPVEISVQNQKSMFVSSGLDQGDQVVTAGVSKLRPGQAVKIMESAQ